jgi:hypothetical protein
MSLDIYLKSKDLVKKTCKCCNNVYEEEEVFYQNNITHNLATMAAAVIVEKETLYKYLWRPDEIDITTANQLIVPLTIGLNELKANPDKYKKFNPGNGWGTYEGLVKFVEEYLAACIEYSDSIIEISR